MKGIATYKVPGGKLVRVKVDFAHSINEVSVTGDFFMHPEEGVADIENCMRGMDSDAPEEKISGRIRDTVSSKGIVMIGVTEDTIARLVKEAMKK